MKRILGILILTLFCLYMMLPVSAQADTVNILINDLFHNVTGTALGFDPADVTIMQGVDMWDMHGEYFSATPPAIGIAYIVNFNIFDPAFEGGALSDTLSITFTGHTPVGNDPDNVSVDLHFRSDPNALLLPNYFTITETGTWQDLSSYVAMAPSAGGAGINDFNIGFQSAVPEPGSIALLAIGLIGVAANLRRRIR